MIPKLSISPNFTIDDIHAIRYYNYELTKDLSQDEKLRYYNDPDFRKRIEELKTSQE
jgi:hypothetical protein